MFCWKWGVLWWRRMLCSWTSVWVSRMKEEGRRKVAAGLWLLWRLDNFNNWHKCPHYFSCKFTTLSCHLWLIHIIIPKSSYYLSLLLLFSSCVILLYSRNIMISFSLLKKKSLGGSYTHSFLLFSFSFKKEKNQFLVLWPWNEIIFNLVSAFSIWLWYLNGAYFFCLNI